MAARPPAKHAMVSVSLPRLIAFRKMDESESPAETAQTADHSEFGA